jgi:hypothetical protein
MSPVVFDASTSEMETAELDIQSVFKESGGSLIKCRDLVYSLGCPASR